MAYLVEDGKYYCALHDTRFAKTGTCARCRAGDAGDHPEDEIDEPLPAPPTGCLSTEDIERALVADANAVATLIANSADVGFDWHIANTVAKLFDSRTKLLRAARELARDREHEVIVKRREKREREMARGAAH